MSFCLRKKTIKIDLNKKVFSPGENIKGHVNLNLKKPIQGEKLKIELIFQMKTEVKFKTWEKILAEGYEKAKHPKKTILEVILDDEKQYCSKVYPFELKIPDDLNEVAKNYLNEFLFKIYPESYPKELREKIEQFVYSDRVNKIGLWFIQTKLEIPHKINLKDKIEIKIG